MKHEKPPPPSSSPRQLAPSCFASSASTYFATPFCPLLLSRTRLDDPPSPFSLSLQSLHSTLNVLPDHQPPGWLFQSPVRWRYNDHRHMNHGPAETCIFMSAAHSLSLPLTLRLSFPQTYTDLPRLLRTPASPFLRSPISTVSCCLRNFGG